MGMKIAIATNKNFYKLTLPIIIQSLIDSGIEKKDIYVFNGGYDEESVENIDGITYYFLNYNSYEYTPLICICENKIESDYWFLLHDTCKVGIKFKELSHKILINNYDKIALKSCPSMSIGAYKYNYLISLTDTLIKIKNMDYSEESMQKWKQWGVPNEDFILWKTEPKPYLYGNDGFNVIDNENWYNTGVERRTEYFPSLDLYKNKSNWTFKSTMCLDL